MRVVVTDYIEPDLDWERDQLAAAGIDLRAYQLKTAGEDALAAATADADVVLVNMAPITPRLVAGWRCCRLVIRHGIGYDNVDVAALTARGITFVNVPDYCVEEVAEQAIALIFALARGIVRTRRVLEASSRARQWNFDEVGGLHRLQGRTVGLVGFGRIGSRVYQKLEGFGFRWLIADPYLSAERKARFGVATVSLPDLLREADIVSLHTPLTAETRHILDARALALMKPTAFVVNTARGGLIDHDALRAAVVEGRVAGAGIDVYEHEPPPPDDPLFGVDRVVLTPHLGWCSVEAAWDIRRKIVQVLLDAQAARPLAHRINGAALDRLALAGQGTAPRGGAA